MPKRREDLFGRAVLRCLRLTEALRRSHERLVSAVEAAALAGLSDASLNALTAALYDRKGGNRNEELFDWEETWFAADLPPPPARLLIGGAGAGREVSALAARGYEILAFDPAPRLARSAARRFAGDPKIDFFEGSYEEMIARRPGALHDALARRERFDAVVFGWGSFTHIVGARTRVDALIRARELCPAGPALLSFWIRDDRDEARGAGRAARLGTALGRLSGRGEAREVGGGDSIAGNAGYCHAFTWDELDALAAECGYVLHRSSRDHGEALYPHLTLRPLG